MHSISRYIIYSFIVIASAFSLAVLLYKLNSRTPVEEIILSDTEQSSPYVNLIDIQEEQDQIEKTAIESEILSDIIIDNEDETDISGEIASDYPVHKDIVSTIFWVGEEANDDNDDISNSPSAWDEKWKKHFGGTDDPDKRSGYWPKKFKPNENPFYAALPYNDFNDSGKRKNEVYNLVYWADSKKWNDNESMLKNRWIKIYKDDKVAYGQWEDVGPFEEDDEDYVFGDSEPSNDENAGAGIDVSPAIGDYLDLSDVDEVDWQFIEDSEVPDGPWMDIVTTSQVYWE